MKLLLTLGFFLSLSNVFATEFLLFSSSQKSFPKSLEIEVTPFLSGFLYKFKEKDLSLIQSLKGEGDIIEENFLVQSFHMGNPIELSDKTKDHSKVQWAIENLGNNEPIRLDRRSPVPGVVGADTKVKEVWSQSTGSEAILIAVPDTGVDYNHSDLKTNMFTNFHELNGKPGVDDDGNGLVDDIRGWDFVNNDNDPQDDMGHGTHVSGIIGALHNNQGIDGVMDRVRILPIKFLDKKGRGDLEGTLKAMEYAVKMKAKIINASWGSSKASDIMKKILIKAEAQGSFIVAAAGNLRGRNNDTSPTYPANYEFENIISVSAHNAQDYHSAFSTWGPKTVDLAAPGTNIVSTFLKGKYKVWSGTSMAAPYVTGALGLMASLNEDLQNARQQLMSTVVKNSTYQGKNISEGRLNIEELISTFR